MGLESLAETTRFIENQWNEEVVGLFLDRLDERINQLKRNPRLAPVYNQSIFRRLLIHPHVTLYYVIEKTFISLVLISANQQDPNELKSRLRKHDN